MSIIPVLVCMLKIAGWMHEIHSIDLTFQTNSYNKDESESKDIVYTCP